MGANVSRERVQTTLSNVFDSSVYSKCPTETVSANQEVGDIDVRDGCDMKLLLSQDVVLEDTCSLKATTESLTDYFVKNKQKIEDGFLPRLANVQDTSTKTAIENQIQSHIDNICPEAEVGLTQKVGNVRCAGAKLDLAMLQKFQGKTACLVDDVIKRADKWEAEQSQNVDRSAGIADLFKVGATAYIVVAVLGVIIILSILYFLTTDSGQQYGKMAAMAMV